MKPQEKVALLTALIAGATAELDKAKTETLTVADAVGVKQFTTPFGNVTIGQSEAKPKVTDDTALLAYVKDSHPTEVETTVRVRPAFVTALLDRVIWNTDLQEFIDTATGEAVPGIAWSQPGDPYVTWPSSAAQRATKEEAKAWFESTTEELLGGMAQIAAPKREAS